MKYQVFWGGTPTVEGEFNTLDKALDKCLDLACRRFEEQGGDPGDIQAYNYIPQGGDAGACPVGDEGGYWPRIRIVAA